MRTILRYYKPFIPSVIGIVLVIFGQVLSELLLPTLMSDIIDNGIVAGDLNRIKTIGLAMIGVSAIALLFTITASFLASRVAAKGAWAIRRDLFHTVTRFSTAELEKFSTASLITRSTNDVQMVQQATVMCLRMMLFAPIMGVGAVIMALRTSVSLSWTVGLALICVCGLMVFAFLTVFPRFKVMQDKLDRINLIMKERLSGTLVVRAFRTEKHEEERFDDANKDLTRLYIFVNKCLAFLLPSMGLIMSGVGVLIVWVGAHLIDAQHLLIGDMMAYLQYAMHVIMSFMFVTMIFVMIPRAAVSAKRIGAVLDTKISITDPAEPARLPQARQAIAAPSEGAKASDVRNTAPSQAAPSLGRVEFRDVAFAYPDASGNAIEGINFIAEPGKTTAIIGGTGSGKSTVINLLPRFYDVTSGQVLLDGVDVRDVKQEDLRDRIGLVPQKGTLFSGTVKSNLLYGNENATLEDLETAAEIAQAIDFIREKPNGFDEEINQGGTNVSGGQKQRLCIARALVKKPEVLVLDDSFSALDFATDKALRKAIRENTENTTLIIVAQRINTVLDAEQIIVLDEGQMVGKGTHGELMRDCAVYREIALSQLSEAELKATEERGEIDG